MNINSTTFFSIVLNVSLTKKFQPSRGIRHGDPISPLLFILMTEGLRKVLKDKVEKRKVKGMNLHPGSEVISHQQFVDHTMLMGNLSVQEA